MIGTVIRNLTSNALKFTPVEGQVVLAAYQNGASPDNEETGWVEVSVRDTGVGISQEDIAKLFKIEVHYTTQGTAKEKGTGLGLILCQEMVEKNGGRIWVESELGQGTTVKFTVPVASFEPAASPERTEVAETIIS
jgi:signal transduction histidine kinase